MLLALCEDRNLSVDCEFAWGSFENVGVRASLFIHSKVHVFGQNVSPLLVKDLLAYDVKSHCIRPFEHFLELGSVVRGGVRWTSLSISGHDSECSGFDVSLPYGT